MAAGVMWVSAGHATDGITSGTHPPPPTPAPTSPAPTTIPSLAEVVIKRFEGGFRGAKPWMTVQFQVAMGGACHVYSADVVQARKNYVLTIQDTLTTGCAAPEKENFQTSVKLGAGSVIPPAGSTILLSNHLYFSNIQL